MNSRMLNNSSNRIIAVVKLHITEQLRMYQLLITNIILPVLFYSISILMIKKSEMSISDLSLLINSQFFSTSLMFGLLTYSFTLPLINLVDIKEKETLLWIRQTKLTTREFTIGNKVANLIFLNLHSFFVIVLFSSLGYLSFSIVTKIIVLINITFFVINPFAFILSTKTKSAAFSNNFSSLLMLLLVFSLTFSTLFSVQLHIDLKEIQKFLLVNPLFGYYDSMLVLAGNSDEYFLGTLFKTLLYLLGFASVTTFIEFKTFKYE